MPAAPKESAKKAVHDPFWLGTRLLELKKLTAGQLETAIAMYRTHPREGFASALERLSFCSQGQIARLLAEKHGLEYVEIPRRGIAAAVVQKLRQVRATHHIVVPYKEEPGRITVAVADPTRYTAVSYTHLDVYKRQECRRSRLVASLPVQRQRRCPNVQLREELHRLHQPLL